MFWKAFQVWLRVQSVDADTFSALVLEVNQRNPSISSEFLHTCRRGPWRRPQPQDKPWRTQLGTAILTTTKYLPACGSWTKTLDTETSSWSILSNVVIRINRWACAVCMCVCVYTKYNTDSLPGLAMSQKPCVRPPLPWVVSYCWQEKQQAQNTHLHGHTHFCPAKSSHLNHTTTLTTAAFGGGWMKLFIFLFFFYIKPICLKEHSGTI